MLRVQGASGGRAGVQWPLEGNFKIYGEKREEVSQRPGKMCGWPVIH
jgi:hypothetical protein